MSKPIAQPSYTAVDKNEEYVCPYDPVHRVSAKRFPIHLTKCRKSHNAEKYVSCPFNQRHQVPELELAYHISTCPDKEAVDDGWTTVPRRNGGRGVNPVLDYSMKAAGRGRGRSR
ncbi:Gametocyte-specific factor 1 [Exaiptasia diaphana]|nr:Gametocyte-specific factor 1 [Exaiptasia diaphana]